MRRSTVIRVIPLVLIASILLLFNSCSVTPEPSETNISTFPGSTDSGSADSHSTVSGSTSRIMYQLFTQHGKIMLKPASRNEYIAGKLNGSVLFYQLSEDGNKWEPAGSSVTKIGSVTGRRFYEYTDSTFDVYKVSIGNWTGYCKRAATELQDDIERRIMTEDDFGNGLEFGLRTQNHTVLQIFDDLYSVGTDDVLRMASSRVTGQYDYSAIDKTGIGDFLGWNWVKDPVCDPCSDSVFYLTSREGDFYNIWKLDIGDGTEKRFCDDISLTLRGVGDEKLIAFLDQTTLNDPIGKLISLSDPGTFTELIEKNWFGADGWLCFDQDPGGILLVKEDEEYQIEINENTFRVFTDKKNIWISNDSTPNGPPKYYRIDTANKMISSEVSSHRMTIKGWNDLLSVLKENEVPFSETDRVDIS